MGKHCYGDDPCPVTACFSIDSGETYNGISLVSKPIRVNRYDAVYPLLLKLERPYEGASYCITLRGYNPMKAKISVSADYVYSGKTESVEDVTVTDIGLKPTFLGSLNAAVSPSNLARINFTVKVDGVPVEFGDNCRAVYGPDADMYPAKFKDTIERIIGEEIEIPAKLQEFMKGEKQSIPMAPTLEALKQYLLG